MSQLLQIELERLRVQVDALVAGSTALLDEDDMVSDSATAGATQQSIKAYVDTGLATKQADLDVPSQAEAEAGTATTERVWTAQRVGQAIAALAGSGTALDRIWVPIVGPIAQFGSPAFGRIDDGTNEAFPGVTLTDGADVGITTPIWTPDHWATFTPYAWFAVGSPAPSAGDWQLQWIFSAVADGEDLATDAHNENAIAFGTYTYPGATTQGGVFRVAGSAITARPTEAQWTRFRRQGNNAADTIGAAVSLFGFELVKAT